MITWYSADQRTVRKAFRKGGNSDAFVIDDNGALVGLLFGGQPGIQATFFTSAADLFEDIKFMTGAVEVDLP